MSQLIKDSDYDDGTDALKPAANAYNLTSGMIDNVDLPIWAKAIYLSTTTTISIVPASDHRESPVPVVFNDHPAGYLQMQVRRVTACDPADDVLILHDNRTKEGDDVPGEGG